MLTLLAAPTIFLSCLPTGNLPLAPIAPPPVLADADKDGLDDNWERNGYGPIVPSTHGCSPNHADLFLIYSYRPNVTPAAVLATVNQVKAFYASIPLRNPDGTNGINVILIPGTPVPASAANQTYQSLRTTVIPANWRGIAHGVLIDGGGGGQTSGPDWCSSGNNWMSVAHELGHQLGLDHKPRGADDYSPVYASLMNYDYSYGFNGTSNVQFSTGKYSRLNLTESRLSEIVPYSAADMAFLSQGPYYFTVAPLGPNACTVDWNRNGVAGEVNVKADINDGYGNQITDVIKGDKTAGAPALAVYRSRLFAIYPDLPTPGEYTRWTSSSLNAAVRGALRYQEATGTSLGGTRTLVESGVCGDPSVAVSNDSLFISYPTSGGYSVAAVRPTTSGKLMVVGTVAETAAGRLVPTLVATGADSQGLWLFLWNSGTNAVSYRKVTAALDNAGAVTMTLGPESRLTEAAGTRAPIASGVPVGLAYNATTSSILLSRTQPLRSFNTRVMTTELRTTQITRTQYVNGRLVPTIDIGWAAQPSRWVMGSGSDASRTQSRIPILVNTSSNAGAAGRIYVYYRGDAAAGQPWDTWMSRQTNDLVHNDGWRECRMGNEWLTTRSAPSAVAFGGDIAYLLRWSGGPDNDRMFLFLHANGIKNNHLSDQDDVAYIRDHGLHESIEAVRAAGS